MTVNLSGRVVLLKFSAVTEYLLDDLEMKAYNDEKSLDSFLRASGLYADEGEPVAALLLTKEGVRNI